MPNVCENLHLCVNYQIYWARYTTYWANYQKYWARYNTYCTATFTTFEQSLYLCDNHQSEPAPCTQKQTSPQRTLTSSKIGVAGYAGTGAFASWPRTLRMHLPLGDTPHVFLCNLTPP